MAAVFTKQVIHADVSFSFPIYLTPPDEKGTHEIPIAIFEAKIGSSKHQLTIEITD